MNITFELVAEVGQETYKATGIEQVVNQAWLLRYSEILAERLLEKDELFSTVLYTGQPIAEIEKRNKETMVVLPPTGCLSEEAIKRITEKSMSLITSDSNTFSLSADKVWAALISATKEELDDLDEARRQRNASNRKIEELTDALDNARMIIERLTAERDRFANMISESSNRWQEMMFALREAKEALVMNIVGTGGRTPAAHNAIATINKVLGEE